MYAVSIDDMRSVTESRNRVGSGNSKEKWLRWNGTSVGGASVEKSKCSMKWIGRRCRGRERMILSSWPAWNVGERDDAMIIPRVGCRSYARRIARVDLIGGIGESWRSFCGQCVRGMVSRISIQVFSMKAFYAAFLRQCGNSEVERAFFSWKSKRSSK